MMKKMCALCIDLKASALYTDVEGENEAAVKLYLKHDFRILKCMKQPDPLRKNREILGGTLKSYLVLGQVLYLKRKLDHEML